MNLPNATDAQLWEKLDDISGSETGKVLLELGFRNLGQNEFKIVISCAESALDLFQEINDLWANL